MSIRVKRNRRKKNPSWLGGNFSKPRGRKSKKKGKEIQAQGKEFQELFFHESRLSNGLPAIPNKKILGLSSLYLPRCERPATGLKRRELCPTDEARLARISVYRKKMSLEWQGIVTGAKLRARTCTQDDAAVAKLSQ